VASASRRIWDSGACFTKEIFENLGVNKPNFRKNTVLLLFIDCFYRDQLDLSKLRGGNS